MTQKVIVPPKVSDFIQAQGDSEEVMNPFAIHFYSMLKALVEDGTATVQLHRIGSKGICQLGVQTGGEWKWYEGSTPYAAMQKCFAHHPALQVVPDIGREFLGTW